MNSITLKLRSQRTKDLGPHIKTKPVSDFYTISISCWWVGKLKVTQIKYDLNDNIIPFAVIEFWEVVCWFYSLYGNVGIMEITKLILANSKAKRVAFVSHDTFYDTPVINTGCN